MMKIGKLKSWGENLKEKTATTNDEKLGVQRNGELSKHCKNQTSGPQISDAKPWQPRGAAQNLLDQKKELRSNSLRKHSDDLNKAKNKVPFSGSCIKDCFSWQQLKPWQRRLSRAPLLVFDSRPSLCRINKSGVLRWLLDCFYYFRQAQRPISWHETNPCNQSL